MEVIDLRASTKEIEDSYIGAGSRDSYIQSIRQLMIFLFDSSRKDVLFSSKTLAILRKADAEDKKRTDKAPGRAKKLETADGSVTAVAASSRNLARPNQEVGTIDDPMEIEDGVNATSPLASVQSSNKSKAKKNQSKSKPGKGEEKRTSLKAAVMSILSHLGEDGKEMPIKLKVLLYDDISNFMRTKKREVMIDKNLAHQWMSSKGNSRKKRVKVPQLKGEKKKATSQSAAVGEAASASTTTENVVASPSTNTGMEIATARTITDSDLAAASTITNNDLADDSTKVKVTLPLSASAYNAIHSAVTFLCRECKIEIPPDMKRSLAKYVKGRKRLTVRMKQSLALKISEGKRAMTCNVYNFIAKLLFNSSSREHIFAHLFLVLDWSLMKRSESVVDCKIDHIWIERDSIVFQFAKSKGHQEGEEHVGPWHVYANPLNPVICPFLSMAIFLFTYPDVLASNSDLFAGTSQYERCGVP